MNRPISTLSMLRATKATIPDPVSREPNCMFSLRTAHRKVSEGKNRAPTVTTASLPIHKPTCWATRLQAPQPSAMPIPTPARLPADEATSLAAIQLYRLSLSRMAAGTMFSEASSMIVDMPISSPGNIGSCR